MRLEIEVWLRGNDFATTDVVDLPLGPARGWTDNDVRVVLKDRPVALRGFSWIVSPLDEGFTIAVEIQLGAAAAGPFDVDQAELEATITRVVAAERLPSPGVPTVH